MNPLIAPKYWKHARQLFNHSTKDYLQISSNIQLTRKRESIGPNKAMTINYLIIIKSNPFDKQNLTVVTLVIDVNVI